MVAQLSMKAGKTCRIYMGQLLVWYFIHFSLITSTLCFQSTQPMKNRAGLDKQNVVTQRALNIDTATVVITINSTILSAAHQEKVLHTLKILLPTNLYFLCSFAKYAFSWAPSNFSHPGSTSNSRTGDIHDASKVSQSWLANYWSARPLPVIMSQKCKNDRRNSGGNAPTKV